MIFIDNQESRSGITDLLDGMGVKYELCTLEFCDYHITGENGLVAIEHKKPEDYLASLISGHLSDQLTRMSQEFSRSFVLIDGPIGPALIEGGVTRRAYLSSLAGTYIKRADAGVKGAVCIIQLDNDWDTAMLLERIQYRMTDPDGLTRTPYIGAPQVIGGNPLVSSLCAIPNVGAVTAQNLLKRFKTVMSVARASPGELKEVKNVGKGTAKSIHEFFRSPYLEEGH